MADFYFAPQYFVAFNRTTQTMFKTELQVYICVKVTEKVWVLGAGLCLPPGGAPPSSRFTFWPIFQPLIAIIDEWCVPSPLETDSSIWPQLKLVEKPVEVVLLVFHLPAHQFPPCSHSTSLTVS